MRVGPKVRPAVRSGQFSNRHHAAILKFFPTVSPPIRASYPSAELSVNNSRISSSSSRRLRCAEFSHPNSKADSKVIIAQIDLSHSRSAGTRPALRSYLRSLFAAAVSHTIP